MANNRLFLVDSETGESIMIAKGFGDWSFRADPDALQKFFETHDFAGAQGACTGLRLKDENDLADVNVDPETLKASHEKVYEKAHERWVKYLRDAELYNIASHRLTDPGTMPPEPRFPTVVLRRESLARFRTNYMLLVNAFAELLGQSPDALSIVHVIEFLQHRRPRDEQALSLDGAELVDETKKLPK